MVLLGYGFDLAFLRVLVWGDFGVWFGFNSVGYFLFAGGDCCLFF